VGITNLKALHHTTWWWYSVLGVVDAGLGEFKKLQVARKHRQDETHHRRTSFHGVKMP
jgi:hypothetical protein